MRTLMFRFLFGMDAHASDFDDSVLGRTLDKIFETGPKRVFSAAALRAAMREDMKVDVVHVDTTSWSLAGIYADSVAKSEALHITHGFSGDTRPDPKQFNYGLVVSRERDQVYLPPASYVQAGWNGQGPSMG